MNHEEREARITAYALNDPSLSATDRAEIETLVGQDAEVRLAVEETRRLAMVLGDSLAAEQSAMPKPTAITIPATPRPTRPVQAWKLQAVAASLVLVAVVGTSLVVRSAWKKEQERAEKLAMKPVGTSAGAMEPLKHTGNLELVSPTLSAPNPIGEATRAQKSLANRQAPDGTTTSKADSVRPEAPPQPSLGPLGPSSGAPGGSGVPGLAGPSDGKPSQPFRPGSPGKPGSNEASPAMPVIRAPGGAPKAPGLSDSVRMATESAYGKAPRSTVEPGQTSPPANDRFGHLIENSFIRVEGQNALSTFGVDVDTASYAIARKYLSMSQLPPADAIRLEEMVNYFPYADKAPEGDDPFAVTVEMAECPWEPSHRLVRLGLKAKPVAPDKRPLSNLVFLLDVSGSMGEQNKLPLVKESLKLLVSQLGENDRVAIVVYAGASGLVLDSTSATKKEKIMDALDRLQAGGSTNGAGGIQQAYEVAAANFIKGGTNRVILCTDGDWNVGTTNTAGLVKLIEQKRETGVFLSVFGFGMGNLRDEMMVKLAGKGNGNYGYIDTIKEANKAFIEQMGGTLVTVAKDVKIQVEFNPAAIKSYRLLGYEKRALAAKDFHDDKKDAGEMGAGHVVTALYELVPVGAADPVAGKVDGLRYQKDADPKPAAKFEKADEAFVVKMRHKKPDADKSTLRELPVSNVTKHFEKASEDFQFSAAVASFAMMLRDSPYKGSSNYSLILELAEAAKKHDPGAYRAEFIEMVKKAKSLSGKQ